MKGKEKVKLSKRFKTAFKAFKDESASSFNTVEVVLIVFISILFGVIVGCLLTFTKSYDIDDPNLKEIKAWLGKNTTAAIGLRNTGTVSMYVIATMVYIFIRAFRMDKV